MFYLKYINGCDVLLWFGIKDIFILWNFNDICEHVRVLDRPNSQEYRLSLQCNIDRFAFFYMTNINLVFIRKIPTFAMASFFILKIF